jgi:hypothetical protein
LFLVIAVANAAHRQLDVDRSVYLIETYWLLRSLWWINHSDGHAIKQSLLYGVQNKAGMDGEAGDVEPFARQLPPHLADAINREVLGKHPSNLRLECHIALRPHLQSCWIPLPCDMLVIGGWGIRGIINPNGGSILQIGPISKYLAREYHGYHR